MKTKKIVMTLLIVFFTLSALICLTSCSYKGNVYLDKVSIVARLNENGDLIVSETWNAVIKGDKTRNLYRNIALKDSEFNTKVEIADVSVTDGDGVSYTRLTRPDNPASGSDANAGAVNAYYVYYGSSSSTAELGCYFESMTYGNKTVTFNYTLKNMGRLYNDCGELYWRIIDTDFSLYIGEIDVDVYLPGNAAVTDETSFWLHTEVEESNTVNRATHIEFNAKELASQSAYFEIRVLSPATLYSDVKKVSGKNAKESIIEQEKADYIAYVSEIEKRRKLGIVSIVVSCVMGVLGILFAVFFPKLYKKSKGEYPEYVREIPEGFTVAEAGHFYYYYSGGGKSSKNRNKLMSATLLDLARKGIIDIAPSTDGNDCTLSASNNATESELNNLTEPEKIMRKLIVRVEDKYGRPFTLKELTSYARSNYGYINDTLNAFLNHSAAKLKKGGYAKSGSPVLLTALGAISCIVGIGLFMLGTYLNYMGIGFVVFGALVAIFAPKVNKLNAKGEAVYESYQGLKRFMLDFTNLKEHELPALILWEEYMVYATMMGISEKVLERLKLKYPELTEPGANGVAYPAHNFIFTYYMLSGRGAFDIGRSINNCFNNVGATAKAMRMAQKTEGFLGKGGGGFGHGGGGFGGGGGGFGGGGGGAR